MDKARISSRHFGAVSCPAFLASGSVTGLYCASKLAIEPAPLLKVLARDANVKRKLDRSDEFDLEALGLTEAVSCFNLSEGAQGRGDQRRWPRAFDRAQTFGRAQNTGHHHRCNGKASMGHGSPLRLRRQLSQLGLRSRFHSVGQRRAGWPVIKLLEQAGIEFRTGASPGVVLRRAGPRSSTDGASAFEAEGCRFKS